MKKTLLLLSLAAALVFTATLSAQERITTVKRDFESHSGFEAGIKLSEHWRLTWAEELYFMNDMRSFEKIYSRVTVSYNLTPHLRIAPMFLLINIRNAANSENQYVADLNFYYTLRTGGWTFTLREAPRIKATDKSYSSRVKRNPEYLLRTHAAVSYRLSERLTPFANAEIFNMLGAPEAVDRFYLQRFRSNAGIKYRFDARNSLSLYWRYDHTVAQTPIFDEDELTAIRSGHKKLHMLGVFYYCDF